MKSYVKCSFHRYEEEKAQHERKKDAQRDHQVRRLHVARRAADEHLEVQQSVRYDVLVARLRLGLLGLHALRQALAGVRVDVVRVGGICGTLRNDAPCRCFGGGVYDWDTAVPRIREKEEKAHHGGSVDRNHPAVRTQLGVQSTVEYIGALNGFIVRRDAVCVLVVRERKESGVQCSYKYTQRHQQWDN